MAPAVSTPATAAAGEPIPWDILLQTTFNETPDRNPDNDPVPTYTSTDASPFVDLLSTHPSLATHLQLPLTTYPPFVCLPEDTDPDEMALAHAPRRIIDAFFCAVAHSRNPSLVALYITHGLVSPDVPDCMGRTPLVAAVEAGDGAMVCTLLNLGAGVNTFAYARDHASRIARLYGYGGRPERTALMVAAARGNLALVKLLREDFGADDALVAPRDGQIALRLAAEAGHRDVVAYLPARRAGAWRRWVVQNRTALGRIKRAAGRVWSFGKVFAWDLPKFVLWDVPGHVLVRPAWKRAKWCWVNKKRFPGWCKRQAAELPGRVKRAGVAVWKGVKQMPKDVWDVVKEVPGAVMRLVKWVWKVVQRIPGAVKQVCGWIWKSLKGVGKAVGRAFLRVVAALHTAVAAVLDFFRNIKLKDVWNGVCDVFDAVFRGLPRAIWKAIVSAGSVASDVIVRLFGLVGEVVVFLVEVLWAVVMYVPEQLGEIISSIWGSIAKGYHEIMVWINPKY